MRFAVLASRAGFAVRWINVDGGGVPWADLATAAAKYPLLEKLADELEFVDDALGFSAGTPPPVVPANPGDLFMGTLFYTVLQARATVAAHPGLRNRNVVNFVQDDEGIFFPHGTSHLEAREAHAGPHFPIFSTDFLRSHFESNRVGLFAHCHPAECAELHFSAQPAIRPRAPFDPALFAPNRTRRLIMYARPLHDRNAFDLGVLALDEAVRRGIFGPRLEERWEFLGVGSHAEHADQCNLGGIRGMCLQMRPSVPEPEYFALLGTGDVGLALMVSPHPSLPPLDFAAAGMATVTNTWGSKTAEALRAAGGNLIPAEPTLEGLVAALEQAVARAEDVEGRMQGSRLDWPERWDDPRCYGAPLWRRMRRWFATTNALW
ncbi:hypothetical protein DFJ74DRAFT_682989 [Hyaloraphidium curvatum]|nr:hypothetical protein DFJ74DRAFT_682989 [Hyaloraphidium curvatum]